MKEVKVLPDTISQLESLKENSQSFIVPDKPLESQIWVDDIAALDNAIEIIKSYQDKTFKPGQAVIYKPYDYIGKVYKEAAGIVKSMSSDGKIAFVWYHTGCTAASTPVVHLHESKITVAHTKIHHGCEECLAKNYETITDLLISEVTKDE